MFYATILIFATSPRVSGLRVTTALIACGGGLSFVVTTFLREVSTGTGRTPPRPTSADDLIVWEILKPILHTSHALLVGTFRKIMINESTNDSERARDENQSVR